MAHDPGEHEHLWERGWDGHERAQRERFARLTLEQKLDWLEEAHRFVLGLRASAAVEGAQGQTKRAD